MRRKRDERDDTSVEVSSGNVFADLGLPDADELIVKAPLIYEIGRIVQERKLTQAQTGKILGLEQPDVSNLLRGRSRGYSVDRLLRFLAILNQDIQIIIQPAKCQDHETACGKISVVAL